MNETLNWLRHYCFGCRQPAWERRQAKLHKRTLRRALSRHDCPPAVKRWCRKTLDRVIVTGEPIMYREFERLWALGYGGRWYLLAMSPRAR